MLEGTMPRLATRLGAVIPGLRVAHAAWNSFDQRWLTTGDAAILLANAADDPERCSQLLAWLKTHAWSGSVIVVLPSGSQDLFAAATEAADDFIFATATDDELRGRVSRLLRLPRLREMHTRLADEIVLRQFAGRDPAFLAEIDKLKRFAQVEAPVLITGETGTGKELCARALHHLGKRKAFPFVAIDCGALPDLLFENEVFGHVRGAYTDAHLDQKGLIAIADRGTLFLDEVDALSPAAQAKLLRFLQEKTFKSLGSDRFTHADVNVIAASNRDLELVVRDGRFRLDLYYRLNVLRIHMPPLRERRGDIEVLALHFLRSMPADGNVRRTLSASALRKMTNYDWPGNARELHNVVQRAAVLAEGAQILARDIAVNGRETPEEAERTSFRAARRDVIDRFERCFIADLLERYSGNISRAARAAGQERRAFGRLVKKHHLAVHRRL